MVQSGSLKGLTIEKVSDNIDGLIKPTLFKSNEFLWPFQEIVNTYGIPTYKEVNPAVFTIVSFPFLFGVMFGDIMHGTWLFVFAAWLCFADRSDPKSFAGALAPVRYLFLLMGIFSFYMGMIYNDFSSLPIQLFGTTCFDKMEVGATDQKVYAHRSDDNCVHPFGMDPVWYRST
jgi:V-type H+-transporting ATPase subunit a